MAKFPYTKLNAKINQEVVHISVEGSEASIEVRQYLPVDEKLGLIGRIIELAHDTNNFSNPLKTKVYYTLEMISAYTNITFTEKQKEAPNKLYDALLSSGWMDTIFNSIPSSERVIVWNGLQDTVKAYYDYRNSAYGIMEVMSQDYSGLEFDISKLTEGLQNGENIEFLKEVMNKLG
jgi:hypothetical protein